MKKTEKCFVIMPFSETTHGERIVTTRAQWDHVYQQWIKRAIGSYKRLRLSCERSASVPGNFVRGIVSDLAESFLVIADVTGNKPNVFYELGIRHALRTGTILITQHLRSLPSDLHSYYAFEYSYTDKAHEYEAAYARFEIELHSKIDAFVDGKVSSDSPVSDFLGFRKEVYDHQLEGEKRQLKRLVIECGKSFERNFHVSEFLLSAFTRRKKVTLKNWPIIDLVPIDALYSKLLSLDLQLLGDDVIKSLTKVVSDHRHMLLMAKQHWEAFRLLNDESTAEQLIGVLGLIVGTHMPAHKKMWPEIVKSVDAITVQLIVSDKGKKRVLSGRKKSLRRKKTL